MNFVSDVKKIDHVCYTDNGNLIPIQFDSSLPFLPKRIFYVYGAPKNCKRGNHAHKNTEQILTCINGSCEIACKDGTSTSYFNLENPKESLYIPSGIWDEIIYLEENTILLVMSSTFYNRDDYIEDFDVFVKYRGSK